MLSSKIIQKKKSCLFRTVDKGYVLLCEVKWTALNTVDYRFLEPSLTHKSRVNSNQKRFFCPYIYIILPSVTRTSRLLEVIFVSLQIISYNLTLDISKTCFEKTANCLGPGPKHWIYLKTIVYDLFFLPINFFLFSPVNDQSLLLNSSFKYHLSFAGFEVKCVWKLNSFAIPFHYFRLHASNAC